MNREQVASVYSIWTGWGGGGGHINRRISRSDSCLDEYDGEARKTIQKRLLKKQIPEW